MAFLEGSKSVSTSIGGSTQTVNFNPVLNARGSSSSGPVGGVSQTQAPTVTTSQNSGAGGSPDSTGLLPSLSVGSSRPVEAISTGDPNYLSQSARSFAPASLNPVAVNTGEVVELSTGLLLALGAAALALWMVWR